MRGDAEAQALFPGSYLLGQSPGRGEHSRDGHHLTALLDAASLLWQPWSNLNVNCTFLSDAHLNMLGRPPKDVAHEKGEIFALKGCCPVIFHNPLNSFAASFLFNWFPLENSC